MWGLKQQNAVIAVGNSIFNRTSKAHGGELVFKYGGGHANAGACQVENSRADAVLKELGHRASILAMATYSIFAPR